MHSLFLSKEAAVCLQKLIRYQVLLYGEAEDGASSAMPEPFTGADLDQIEPLLIQIKEITGDR